MPQLIGRIRANAKHLATQPVRFGSPHHSHAVLAEAGVFRVRQLFLPREKVDAYLAEHRTFMPEHAEFLSEPTGPVELEAATLEGLISSLENSRFRL